MGPSVSSNDALLQETTQDTQSPVLFCCILFFRELPVLGEEPMSECKFFLSVAPRVLVVFWLVHTQLLTIKNFSQVLLSIVV